MDKGPEEKSLKFLELSQNQNHPAAPAAGKIKHLATFHLAKFGMYIDVLNHCMALLETPLLRVFLGNTFQCLQPGQRPCLLRHSPSSFSIEAPFLLKLNLF